LTRLDLEGLRVAVLEAGTLWLDGGSMFGVVPRPLWERERVPDERNRIPLVMTLLLVEDGRRRTLVDTGAGLKLEAKTAELYRMEALSMEEILRPAGLRPGDIDRVINTHLHFDHAGGNTVADQDGELRAALPNAEYVVQRAELEIARLGNERTRTAFLPADFEPLAAEKGRLRVVDGDLSLDAHVSVRLAPGHTPGLQAVLVADGDRTVAFLGDLVPTTSHVRLPWIMAYDLDPLATLESKKHLLAEAAAGRWIVVFQHDPETSLGTLEPANGRLAVRPWRPGARG